MKQGDLPKTTPTTEATPTDSAEPTEIVTVDLPAETTPNRTVVSEATPTETAISEASPIDISDDTLSITNILKHETTPPIPVTIATETPPTQDETKEVKSQSDGSGTYIHTYSAHR